MGATEKIAYFITNTTYEDIPSHAVELAKRTIIDTVASALAGCAEPGSKLFTQYVQSLDGPLQAGVIGEGRRAAVAEAAFVNGYIAHALDYDDCAMKIGHPSVMVLPAILSLGQYLHCSGRELLTSYILGLEVEGKIALHTDFRLMDSSLSNQSWYGSLGAAAACAKLLHLDTGQIRMALGIAANMVCGVQANDGSQISPMSAGSACRNGVVAALMAREGITANPDIIESKNGFLYALAGPGHYDADCLAEDLGRPFFIVSPGIGLKRYPSCYHTHRSIDAVLQIMARHHLKEQDIAEVDVGTSERALRVLSFSDPQTPYQAKFCMPHCIAAAMVDGNIALGAFTMEKVLDPVIIEARKKVRLSFPAEPIWPGLADVGPDTVFVGNPVTMRTKVGESYSTRVDILRGDPALPLTDDELLAKYRECGQQLLTAESVLRSSNLLFELERVADIGQIMEMVTPVACL